MPEARKRPSAPTRREGASGGATRTKLVLWLVGVVVLAGALLFVPAALLTDRPAFCKTCHTMVPFYNAWEQGPHKDIWCIDCHIDSGMAHRFEHKPAALKEVYAEFFTRATFPNYDAAVPDARCERCHPDVARLTATPTTTFSHVTHLNKGVKCAQCHASTGHKVTFFALNDAGLLNSANAPAGLSYVGGKPSALPGHKPIPCTSCHDQAHLQCSFCHATPANHYGADCTSCHQPGRPFANFVHPPTGEHGYKSRPCVKCHPNGYKTAYCTCHKGNPPSGD
jgi:nitrate/TMAO reductase-like tetraheme cytochrome c subunit